MKKTLALVAAALVSACSGSDKNDNFPGPGEPNGTIETATPMTAGTPVVATVSQGNDYDFYEFTVPGGGATVHVQTFDSSGVNCGNASLDVDTSVDVFDSTGAHVGFYDDTYSNATFVNFCESFDVQLPAGTSYVAVSGYPPYPFDYTLSVTIL